MPPAFEAIYQRYERRIYSYIYRLMGNAEDASDLTQDTFVKAYQALPRAQGEMNLSAWLHRIASNTCLTCCAAGGWSSGSPGCVRHLPGASNRPRPTIPPAVMSGKKRRQKCSAS